MHIHTSAKYLQNSKLAIDCKYCITINYISINTPCASKYCTFAINHLPTTYTWHIHMILKLGEFFFRGDEESGLYLADGMLGRRQVLGRRRRRGRLRWLASGDGEGQGAYAAAWGASSLWSNAGERGQADEKEGGEGDGGNGDRPQRPGGWRRWMNRKNIRSTRSGWE